MALTDEEKKDIYKRWRELINMSETALNSWAEDDNRLLASINRQEAKDSGGIQSGYDSFHRIKRRKTKPMKDWSDEDYKNAKQEIGFNSRMLGGKPGDPVGESRMSKWEISLRNWGHDPSLKSSPQHAKWEAWRAKHYGKKGSTMKITASDLAHTYFCEQKIKRAVIAGQKSGHSEMARVYGHLLRRGGRVASNSLGDVSQHFASAMAGDATLRESLGLTYLQEIINQTADKISSTARSAISIISDFLSREGLSGKVDYLIKATFKPTTKLEQVIAGRLGQTKKDPAGTLTMMGHLLSASTPQDFANVLNLSFAQMRDLFGVSENLPPSMGSGSWFMQKWEQVSQYVVGMEDAKLLVVKVGLTILKVAILSLLFGTPLAAVGSKVLSIVVVLVVLVILTNKRTTANIIRKMGISLAVFTSGFLIDLVKGFKFLGSVGGDMLNQVKSLFKSAAVREINHLLSTDMNFRKAYLNA